MKNFCCAFDLFSHRYNNAHTHTRLCGRVCLQLGVQLGLQHTAASADSILHFLDFYIFFAPIFWLLFFAHQRGEYHHQCTNRHTHTHRGTRGGRLLRATGLLPLCTLTSQQSRILIFVYFAFFYAPILLCCTLSLAQRTTYYCCFCLSCCCCCLASSSSLIFVAVMALLPTFFALFRGFSTFPRTLL